MKNNNNIKHIKISNLIICLGIFSLFVPVGLGVLFKPIHYISILYRVCVLLLLLLTVKVKANDAMLLFLYGFMGYLFFITVINKGSLVQFFLVLITNTIIVLIIIGAKQNLAYYCWITSWIVLLADFLCMIIFPNGLFESRSHNKVFMFFSDNSLSFLTVFATVFFEIYLLDVQNRQKKRLLRLMFYFIILFEVVKSESGTAILSYILMIFLLILRDKINFYKKRLIIAISIVAFNIWMLLQSSLPQFTWLFDLVKKDSTLSLRTSIWDLGILIMKESWLFGYGYTSSGYYIPFGRESVEAHNFLLEMMLEGGVIAVILFGIVVSINLKKFTASNSNTIILIGLLIYSVIFLVESPVNIWYFYFILFYGYYNSKKRGTINEDNRCYSS